MSIFIIAEIGINHNGDLNIAKDLIDVAVDAGALPTDPRVLVARLKEAGLRKRKRG